MRETATAAILDAVEELANERGFEQTSIAAIAERAGVAVGTLYNYFPDRDGMFAALFEVRRAALAPRITDAATKAAYLPFAQRLRAYMRGTTAAFDEKREFVRLAMALDANNHALARSTSLMQLIQHHLEDIFRDAIAQGAVREALGASAYALLVVGAMRAIKRWSFEHAGKPYDSDFIVDTFLNGVLATGTKGASRTR
jgi:AcrR family transcriptional regulator